MTGIDKADLRRQALEGRQRILDTLELPPLTGTGEQIAWAESLRKGRIERALTAHVHFKRGVEYRLRTMFEDPLGVNYLHEIPTILASVDEALAALRTATRHGQRTTAAWWIDNRAVDAPMG